MGKLKENAFVLGVVGVVIVCGALFWFLVLAPIFDLQKNKSLLEKSGRDVSGFLKEDVLPTPAYLEAAAQSRASAQEEFTKAVTALERRVGAFDLFFGDEKNPPDPATFYSKYTDLIDGSNGLRKTYRAKYELAAIDDEEDESRQMPRVEMIDSAEFQAGAAAGERIRQGMKETWITQAIFQACDKLEIGGLEEISFKQTDDRSSRRRRESADASAAAAEGPKDKVEFKTLEAEVKVHMSYGKLQPFLAELAANDRVPFLHPKEIMFSQSEKELKRLGRLTRIEEYPSEDAARSADVNYDKLIPEPVLDFELTLLVLDWDGVTLAEAEEAGAGDDDDDDDDL